ncbi:MAG: hypothetical protein H7840_16260 [Alphaproteobacteria bacterium]
MEAGQEVVTDSAIGEAAYRTLAGQDHHLVGFSPSDWCFSPITVTWETDQGTRTIQIPNYWNETTIKNALVAAPAIIDSWKAMERVARARFINLTFSGDCFNPLKGLPYASSAADEIIKRLDVLDRLKACIDSHGRYNDEANEIIHDHFSATGDKKEASGVWFSDSSDYEINHYKMDLTFRHPLCSNEYVFCPWHGKVRTQNLRIHFSFPIRKDEPLFVVYVGRKITR